MDDELLLKLFEDKKEEFILELDFIFLFFSL